MFRSATAVAWGFSLLVLLAGALTLAGCSTEEKPTTTGDPNSLDPSQQTVDLDDPHGGLLAVNEDPAFGDEDLVAAQLEDDPVDDGYAGLDPTERAQAQDIENNKLVWYSLTVLWGNLDARDNTTPPGPSQEVPNPVVWDGSMWTHSGAIRVLRLISFEKPEDYLPDSRPHPQALSWASVTHGDFDGLHVLLSFRRGADVPPGQVPEDTLRFQAGPCGELSFPIAQLGDLSVIFDIPDSQEKVSFTAFRVEPAMSVRGFVAGKWGWATADSVGRFAGRWISCEGLTMGHMRGHYGENSQGERVFFGKYVDNAGRFQGFLQGTYQILRRVGDPDQPAGALVNYEIGEFHGRWEDKDGDMLGDLHGSWSRVGRRPGVFSGSWRGMGIAP
jgi:hypothetical protein